MRTDDIIVYDSLADNSIPTRDQKSVMRRWFEQLIPTAPIRPGDQIRGGLSVFRKGTEAVGAGAALALIHVETEGGLDKMGVPLDGLSGAALMIGSAIWPNSEVSPDARDIGADALTIFAFRKTMDLLVEKRLSAGRALPRHLSPANRIAGEESSDDPRSDPIVNAAEGL